MAGTIAIFYHWLDPFHDRKLTRETLTNDQPLYVCDDTFSWAAPHVEGMELYEIDARWSKPLIITGQFEDYETLFSDHNKINETFLRNGEFDAVFYTPHYLSRGVRQISLLRPKDQVLAIRRVPDIEIDWASIKAQREDQNKGWSNIMVRETHRFKNPYFFEKKVYLDGLTIYDPANMELAVRRLGGEVCQNPLNADLIIYGKNSEIAKDMQPMTLYPHAVTSWEGKVDDLVQELEEGIRQLF